MGAIGTLVGVGAFLAFLLLASHLAVGLYAHNVVAASTWTAARKIAHESHNPAIQSTSLATLRHDLRGFRNVEISTQITEQNVQILVKARQVNLLPSLLQEVPLLGEVRHTTTIRTESIR